MQTFLKTAAVGQQIRIPCPGGIGAESDQRGKSVLHVCVCLRPVLRRAGVRAETGPMGVNTLRQDPAAQSQPPQRAGKRDFLIEQPAFRVAELCLQFQQTTEVRLQAFHYGGKFRRLAEDGFNNQRLGGNAGIAGSQPVAGIIDKRNAAAQIFDIDQQLLLGQNTRKVFTPCSVSQCSYAFQIPEHKPENQPEQSKNGQGKKQRKAVNADMTEFFCHGVIFSEC